MTLIGKLMQHIISLGVINGHNIDIRILIKKLLELVYFSVGEYSLKYLALSKATLHRHFVKSIIINIMIDIKILS